MILALIGMTGVGKSTVGRILARKLNFNYIDTDELITAYAKKSPAQIFEQSGEQIFRDIESDVLEDIFARYKNIILSCGGGIITRGSNRELLKAHARVIWLTRPLEQILADPQILARPPINNNPGNYIKILKARESLYAQTCHLKIDFICAETAADQIIAHIS